MAIISATRPDSGSADKATDGRMSIADHLRELRKRLTIAMLAIGVGAIVGWVWFDSIFTALTAPFTAYQRDAVRSGRTVELTLSGITSAFSLKLQVAFFVGLLLATPVWTYQLWAFVRPGLHPKERRLSLAFVLASTPLFLAGVALAYAILPKTLVVLFGFTPGGVANLPTVSEYLSFVFRLALAFGLAFLTPVVIVALNLAGVLTAKRLRAWWRWAVLIVFVFAAVITPTPDAVTMTLLAAPMLVLLAFAWLFAVVHDRRAARRAARDALLDGVPSPLDYADPIEPPTPLDR